MAGLSIAFFLANQAHHRHVSQCAWYFVAFTFDTTLGVAIALGLHTAAVKAAKRLVSEEPRSPVLISIAECGNYGEAVLDDFRAHDNALYLPPYVQCII